MRTCYKYQRSFPSSLFHIHNKISRKSEMIDDQGLGFIANFLGIFIFALVVLYHFVTADPKYEAS